MKTWVYGRAKITPCGSCTADIPQGTPLLEIRIGESKRARCVACAKRMFDEEPPAAIEEVVPVPQPSLPMPLSRGSDFVTPRQLARHLQYQDFRKRAAGDR